MGNYYCSDYTLVSNSSGTERVLQKGKLTPCIWCVKPVECLHDITTTTLKMNHLCLNVKLLLISYA